VNGERDSKKLLDRYGCGPVQFTGAGDALYERHLLFDAVVIRGPWARGERYEAVARSVRDVLSHRWLRVVEHAGGSQAAVHVQAYELALPPAQPSRAAIARPPDVAARADVRQAVARLRS
jgi:hypothetical protein